MLTLVLAVLPGLVAPATGPALEHSIEPVLASLLAWAEDHEQRRPERLGASRRPSVTSMSVTRYGCNKTLE